MKRVISLILVFCFIALALVACGKKENETSGTTGTTKPKVTNKYGEEEVLDEDYWENVKFENEVLNVIARDDYKVSKEWEQDETASDVDGFGKIVAARNNVVEGDLGLDVRVTFEGDQWSSTFREEILSVIQSDVEEGMNAYDIVACYGYGGLNTAYRDLWANLLDKDLFPHFDFSLPCWNQDLTKNGAVNNRMYICAGDFNISMFDSAMIMWHNKNLYESLLKKTQDKESPLDIQDTVTAGNWTYSELFKWANYHENLDAESNSGDIFGLYMNGEQYPTEPFDVIPYAWDIDFMLKDEQTGKYSYNFVGNTKANEAIKQFRDLWSQKGTATETTKGPSFPSGRLLFKASVIWFDEAGCIARREMKDRFSILPWPKYDEKQDHYASTSQDYYTTMAVVNHARSPITTRGEQISAYMQYGTEYSYTNVRMTYFKEIVEQKYFGQFPDGTTEKSIAIFNTIIENLEYDFATIYSPMLGGVVSQCWRMNVLLKNDGVSKDLGTTTVSQKFADNDDAYDKALDELYEWFGLEG